MRWRGVAGKEGHSLTLNGALKLAVSFARRLQACCPDFLARLLPNLLAPSSAEACAGDERAQNRFRTNPT